MAANVIPIFPIILSTAMVQISAANTNRDGTGTTYTLVTGDADGSRGGNIVICGTGATTAGVIRLYIYDSTNTYLIDEILVQAVTPSTTVKVWQYPYRLPKEFFMNLKSASWSIKVSTHVAETFNVFWFGDDY